MRPASYVLPKILVLFEPVELLSELHCAIVLLRAIYIGLLTKITPAPQGFICIYKASPAPSPYERAACFRRSP